jgi:hypothetical protein
MRMSVSTNRDVVGDYAISLPAGWTVFQRAYLDQPENFECIKQGGSLIACLANTISHEYTHYSVSAFSGDGTKGAVNDDNYISYGIGDLTQSLEFPEGKKLRRDSPFSWRHILSCREISGQLVLDVLFLPVSRVLGNCDSIVSENAVFRELNNARRRR